MPRPKVPKSDTDPIVARLDAIIRLLIEVNNPKNSEGITEPAAVRVLNSAGLGPTDIAKILGKPRTSVAPYLFGNRD